MACKLIFKFSLQAFTLNYYSLTAQNEKKVVAKHSLNFIYSGNWLHSYCCSCN